MIEHNFPSKKPITAGWSQDKKYQVTDSNGNHYLLRLSPIELRENREKLFAILQQIDKLNIPMCRLVDCGICQEGIYSLQTWINGTDAEKVIANFPKQKQYAFGRQAGEILTKIHSLPAPAQQENWYSKFNRKTDQKIKIYREGSLRFPGDHQIIEYIQKNRHLLMNRPQCFQHGDYHVGNMMIENEKIVIIDFDRYDYGDPWEEFNRIVWCAQVSAEFSTGIIDGYFNNNPPLEFWGLLKFYIASNMLSSITWAIPFGEKEINVMLKLNENILQWFDNFNQSVPAWYLPHFKNQ